MVLAKCGPCLHIPVLGVGGCVSITWGSAGVRRSVIASVCKMYVCSVNAPQKNKTSFHQAPIIELHHSSYIQCCFFVVFCFSSKSTGYMANMCYG